MFREYFCFVLGPYTLAALFLSLCASKLALIAIAVVVIASIIVFTVDELAVTNFILEFATFLGLQVLGFSGFAFAFYAYIKWHATKDTPK